MSAGPFAALLVALDEHNVEYMIIGGQAAVAYGATQFTRDADIWVNPTRGNLARLRKALNDIGAQPRFLPPLELSYLRRGHGVHFRFRWDAREFLLDILGRPPRVKGFRTARKDALPIRWHGVSVPIIDVFRLVATKKTDREKDYVVIRSLVEMVFHQAARTSGDRERTAGWLARESRNPAHLLAIARRWPGGKRALLQSRRPAAVLAANGAPPNDIEQALAIEMKRLQAKSRDYWRPFLRELRRMRRHTRRQDRSSPLTSR